jgi:hypothetical protein
VPAALLTAATTLLPTAEQEHLDLLDDLLLAQDVVPPGKLRRLIVQVP